MVDLFTLKGKTKKEIVSNNYDKMIILSDRVGHVCIQQIDDCIWFDDEDLDSVINALMEIKNANSNK